MLEVTPRMHLIAGRCVPSGDGRTLSVIDPSTGERFAAIARGGIEEIDRAVAAARQAATGAWGRMPAVERGRILARLSGLIEREFEALWRIEAEDTGKPASQAKADIRAAARYFEFYGGAPDKHHGTTIPYRDGYLVMTVREPYGVTGHIIPWNYPAQVFGRTIGGALAAGNACVLKPAEDACLTPLRLAELALEAGLPEGALNVVTGLGAEAGQALAEHPGLDHVSFTGSPAVGALIQAASARFNRPVTMELGGKSPQILFADADLDRALPTIVAAAIQNAGQTCSAGSRLLVERRIAGAVASALEERFARLVTGAWRQDLDCGPLISARQVARVERYLAAAKHDGIPILAEGQLSGDAAPGGFWRPPLLLGPVPPDHLVAQEELFGPVLAIIPFEDETEAVRIANGTPFGLAAGIWTRDGARGMRLARALKAGQVFVNDYGAGGGVELPFGGVKRSGFGREKAMEGLDQFSVVKTIVVRHD